MDVIARLDQTVNDFSNTTRIFNEPMTLERAKMFVCQHRLNSRERNSALKHAVAANCPHWELRIKILAGCSQEVIADDEFGAGKPHWAILEDLGTHIGMAREEIRNAKPLPTTHLAWLAWEALIRNRHWLEGLIANTCAERVNVPGYGTGEFRERGWFGMECGRWKKLFGLTDEQVHFFELHGPADLEHSNMGWQTVARYAEELKMEDAIVEACRVNLFVWQTYLDGIVAAADALAIDGLTSRRVG
jgi:pyrroloquinoline quinone (PQQ) biosynthesis protein C